MNDAAALLPPLDPRPSRRRRLLLWAALVGLLVIAQTLLVVMTVAYEDNRAQEQADGVAADAASDIKRDVLRATQDLQTLTWSAGTPAEWAERARQQMDLRREVLRIERRDTALAIHEAVDSPYRPRLFSRLSRDELDVETEVTCAAARRTATPQFSRSYFVPLENGLGVEVMDLCLPMQVAGRDAGFVVATWSLVQMLDGALGTSAPRHELSFVEGDGARLARAGAPRGAGVYVAFRMVDLPGRSLQLRADGAAGRPSLIPNLTLALVLGLSIALFGVVLLLARDVRRRAVAERALAESLACGIL